MTSEAEAVLLSAAERGDWAAFDRLADQVDAEATAKEARLNAPDALASAALWYATTLRLPVFPCVPGGKRPATRHGLYDAKTDIEQVRAWWAAIPDANIGLPTGGPFDVIDSDGPAGARSYGITDIEENGLDLLGWALTPHGRHYYVPATGDGNRAGILPGVDYRGAGGYVLAPPSRTICDKTAGDCHNSGPHVYRWARPLRLGASHG